MRTLARQPEAPARVGPERAVALFSTTLSLLFLPKVLSMLIVMKDGVRAYGGVLRLAADARRLDVSPAWFNWVAAAPTLELVEESGKARGVKVKDVQFSQLHGVDLYDMDGDGLKDIVTSRDPGDWIDEQLARRPRGVVAQSPFPSAVRCPPISCLPSALVTTKVRSS
mgnify:CR=1 FL=1